jgi:hypothetical protein
MQQLCKSICFGLMTCSLGLMQRGLRKEAGLVSGQLLIKESEVMVKF